MCSVYDLIRYIVDSTRIKIPYPLLVFPQICVAFCVESLIVLWCGSSLSSSVGNSSLIVLWLSVFCVFLHLSEDDQRSLILAFPGQTDLHYGTRFSHNKTMCHLYDPDQYAKTMVTGT